jgi:putative cell wall-binding protein
VRRLLLLAAMLSLVLAGLPGAASAQVPRPEYRVQDPAFTDAAGTVPFTALPGAEVHVGALDVGGQGEAGYRIEVPADWNGTLVLYAHGFVSAAQEALVVQNPPLREFLVSQGIAWAASSYSRNGYVIDEAVEETHALLTAFTDITGAPAPTQTIFHGVSMGGHITGAAIEARPTAYSGALPVCGVMGDLDLFDYFLDVNAVAATLAGQELPIPGGQGYIAGTAQAIDAALGLTAGLTAPAGARYAEVVEQLSGGERPIFEESFAFWNRDAAVDLGPAGRVPFLQTVYSKALSSFILDPVGIDAATSNVDTTYAFDTLVDRAASAPEVALNAAVPRVPQEGPAPFATLAADFRIPVLTLHTIGDLFVPMSMQQRYAERANAAGTEELLVQRAIRATGHCTFSPEELIEGFTDLIAWVGRDGAEPPAGDDFLDASAVADRDFGCAFTRGERGGLPACGDAPAVARVAGPDRIATALALAEDAAEGGTVILARSDEPADALAGSGVAGALDAPVLLTGTAALDERVAARLAELAPARILLLGGTAALSAAVEVAAGGLAADVQRIAGANRFATAAAAATAVTEVAVPQEVFVVSGTTFPDAVAVGGLAAFTGAPVLLTADGLPAETATSLAELDLPVTIVGGPAAVSAEVEGGIAGLDLPVGRLSGITRYGTSAAVAERSIAEGVAANRTVVVTGRDFPDALAAGPAAAATGAQLLLVDGLDAAGSPETVARITGAGAVVDRVTAAGGGAVLTPAVLDALRGTAG